MDHFFDHDTEHEHLDQDQIAAAVHDYHEKRLAKAVFWGNISRLLIMAYVFIGGGYEIITGITHHHVQASFVFSFMSMLIFVGRINYALYSQATRTIWADICGAAVMLSLSVLHVIINGTFF